MELFALETKINFKDIYVKKISKRPYEMKKKIKSR